MLYQFPIVCLVNFAIAITVGQEHIGLRHDIAQDSYGATTIFAALQNTKYLTSSTETAAIMASEQNQEYFKYVGSCPCPMVWPCEGPDEIIEPAVDEEVYMRNRLLCHFI